MIVDLLARKPPSNRRRRRRVHVPDLVTAVHARLPTRKTAPQRDNDACNPELVEPPRVMLSRVGAWVAALVCLALIVGVALSFDQYTSRTQRFVVSDYRVNGNSHVSEQDIVAATGVSPGTPMLAVAPPQARARLEALAWIKRAKVQPILPSLIVVDVEEYVPVAMVASGELWLVDSDGVLFEQVNASAAHDLPLLSGLPIDALLPATKASNDNVVLQRGRLLGAIALLQGVLTSPIATQFDLSEVHWDPVQGMTLVSARDGAEVRLGHDVLDDLPRKLERLERLLADTQRRGERLRYALMDDARRPERATISAIPAGARVALPGVHDSMAGGAARPEPPKAAPAAANSAHKKRIKRSPKRRKDSAERDEASPDPTEPGA